MTWVVHYRLERDAGLGDDERVALADHVAAHGEGWTVARYGLEIGGDPPMVAYGLTTLPLDFTHGDPPRLLAALTALRVAIAGAVLVIIDSRGLIDWDPRAARYELNAGVVPAAVPAPVSR